MSLKPAFAFLTPFLLLGCLVPMHLYPIRAGSTQPVLHGHASINTVTFTLPSGEVCKGRWTRVTPNTPASTDPDADLRALWDEVYGPGFYLSQVLGSVNHGQALLLGDRGTRLRVEFYQGTVKGSPLLGVGRDGQGTAYKLTY